VQPLAEFPSDLLAMRSLDTREGVRRIGGKVDAYRKQLQRFRKHHAGAAGELARLIRQRELERAEDYCHALKGVTGNIGATVLFERLVEVDTQLKDRMIPDESILENVVDLLATVTTEIDSMLSTAPDNTEPARSLSNAGTIERLDQLEQALNYDLGAADALLAELRAALAGKEGESTINEIAAKAELFATDEALTLVTTLRRKLNQRVT
jgi:HPt (histidine-containing phosphotransfer) domain-containing protein